jgi:hypothetical protein
VIIKKLNLGFFCFLEGLVVLWFGIQCLTLARQVLCYSSHAPSPFGLLLFRYGFIFFSLGQPQTVMLLSMPPL